MPFNVQFEDEHFLDIHNRPETIESPLVRFLVRHHVFKNKKNAYVVLITLIILIFGTAFGFLISTEIRIQNSELQSNQSVSTAPTTPAK
jgi:predicted PurR-regulated permease PerM